LNNTRRISIRLILICIALPLPARAVRCIGRTHEPETVTRPSSTIAAAATIAADTDGDGIADDEDSDDEQQSDAALPNGLTLIHPPFLRLSFLCESQSFPTEQGSSLVFHPPRASGYYRIAINP
jgi:hypothetical protein